jgi:hypothetical protein
MGICIYGLFNVDDFVKNAVEESRIDVYLVDFDILAPENFSLTTQLPCRRQPGPVMPTTLIPSFFVPEALAKVYTFQTNLGKFVRHYSLKRNVVSKGCTFQNSDASTI